MDNKRLQFLIFEKSKSLKFKVLLICTAEGPSFQGHVIRKMFAAGAQRRDFTVGTFFLGGGATEMVGHKEKTFRYFQRRRVLFCDSVQQHIPRGARNLVEYFRLVPSP